MIDISVYKKDFHFFFEKANSLFNQDKIINFLKKAIISLESLIDFDKNENNKPFYMKKKEEIEKSIGEISKMLSEDKFLKLKNQMEKIIGEYTKKKEDMIGVEDEYLKLKNQFIDDEQVKDMSMVSIRNKAKLFATSAVKYDKLEEY